MPDSFASENNGYQSSLLDIHFSSTTTNELKYQKIMELGAQLPPFPQSELKDENIVPGCQSTVYICAEQIDGKVYFKACSDSLLSAGLAYMAIHYFNCLTPDEILVTKPDFIDRLDLIKSLTPGRSNGLASMISTIKKKALYFIIKIK